MISPSFHLAWRNLFRNTRRTAASLVTVAFGAAGLLIYQGFNEGITNQYRENTIRVRYGNGQVFPKGYHDKVLEKPWEAWIENPDDIEKKIASVPNVLGVYPRLSFYCFLTRGGTTLAAKGEGTRPEKESQFFNRMNFIAGGDIKDPLQVILGKGLAHSLDAKVGDRVTLLGQTVGGQLNGVDVTVAGIFHTGSKDFDDALFRMDLKTAQQLLDTQRVEHFALQTAGVQVWDQVAKNIAQKLPALEAISFDDLDAVYYKNSVAFLQAQFNFIRSIILFIVALGIFNTIAVGLLERGPEVGALRANGEKRTRLFKILFIENMLLGVLGGVLGVLVAKLVEMTLLSKGIPMPPGPGITRQFFTFLEIQPNHYFQAILLPAVTAVVASLWPIWQLLRKPITELLRSH